MTTPRSYVSTFAALLVLASFVAKAQDLSLAARQSDFKAFVSYFEENYAYLDRADKPWLSWEARYSGAVAAADSSASFDTILANALSELHDFHAEVRSPVPDRWLPVPTFADMWARIDGNGVMVTAVRAGSDAEHAGIQVGDRVLSVGGVPVEQAIANHLANSTDTQTPQAREWAILSILTGRAEETRTISFSQNGHKRTVTLPLERHIDRGSGELTAKLLPGNIGLIRFNNSLGEQKTVAAFDAALESMRSTQGLILDLRDVPSGGDSSVTLGIMGRFVTAMEPYQRHRIPNYGQPDVERDWIELVTPRGPFTYLAPVVVLVDHWTGSMGEGIAIGFDAMKRGLVVGTPMAHLAGAVSDYTLPQTKTRVAFATEQLFHVNGTPRQDWTPRVLLTLQSEEQEDVILKRGLNVLPEASKMLGAVPSIPCSVPAIHPLQ